MLPFWLAYRHRAEILPQLAVMGVRVTLRLEEEGPESYYMIDAPSRIHAALVEMRRTVAVDGVIVGNEPDNPFDLRYDSPDWGQGWAYQHRDATERVMAALRGVGGVAIVSAGHTMRSISEDEPPAPGKTAWAEICRPAYSRMDGNAVHIYGYSWRSWVDRFRTQFALKEAAMLLHKPLWIGEFAVNTGTQMERMTAYVEFCRVVLASEWMRGRVKMLSLFVSNGTGQHYDPGFIINNRECYLALGNFIRAGA